MISVALTIAGSDPSGGAGIQADLKTFHQFGVYGAAVVTLVTVQNTRRVSRVEVLPSGLVLEQIAAVLEDLPPAAAKTGALGNLEIVAAVAEAAREFTFPLVVDPVMISKHGAPLVSEAARQALAERLAPRAFLITPNLAEAAALTGMTVSNVGDMRKAAEALVRQGARAALVKGGHLVGPAVDVLFDGDRAYEFASERIATTHTHGTGCTYSAAITAELARGTALEEAVAHAKRYVTEAIRTHPGLGHGAGPVNHFAAPVTGGPATLR